MANKFRIFLILIFSVCLIPSSFLFSASANSLWNDKSTSLYSAQKVFKEGDIVTILVIESSTALSSAGTNTDVKDDLSAWFTNIGYGNTGTSPRSQAEIRGENNYTGTGKTTRANTIQAKIAAVVTKVLSNGNLAVSGVHTVIVNDERQEIKVNGIVRPQDITSANTVFSYQVAQAEISVMGEGSVAEAQNPGWFTRFLNWLF